MTAVQRIFTALVSVIGLAFLSWLTVSPGTPQTYAPFNVLVLLPMMLVGSADLGLPVAVVLVPAFFCLWCWPLLRGTIALPNRSIVLLLCATILSAIWLVNGFSYGIEYQGRGYTVGVAIINFVCWILLGTLALLARCRPSYSYSLGFHLALFAWLAWCAFPYLGELP